MSRREGIDSRLRGGYSGMSLERSWGRISRATTTAGEGFRMAKTVVIYTQPG